MTLTNNYWWLLVWVFAVGGLLAISIPKKLELIDKKKGIYEERWSWIPAIILAVPYVIWAGYRQWVGDTEVYRRTFFDVPSFFNGIGDYMQTVQKDEGFTILTSIMKTFIGNSDVWFFLIIAAFQIFSVVYIYRKYSTNFFLSFLLFIISADYVSWCMNGMRQFIAVTIIFLCTGLILKKKYIPLIIIILLASTIHGSAILMLPVVFIVQGEAFSKKTIIALIVSVVVIIFAGQFFEALNGALQDTQYSTTINDEVWESSEGTNIIRVLVYAVPSIMAFFFRKKISESDNKLINISVNMSCISTALYAISSVSSGIYIGRLPIYMSLYNYILLPWILKYMIEDKRTQDTLYFCMIFAYLIFFYYQMHSVWGLL